MQVQANPGYHKWLQKYIMIPCWNLNLNIYKWELCNSHIVIENRNHDMALMWYIFWGDIIKLFLLPNMLSQHIWYLLESFDRGGRREGNLGRLGSNIVQENLVHSFDKHFHHTRQGCQCCFSSWKGCFESNYLELRYNSTIATQFQKFSRNIQHSWASAHSTLLFCHIKFHSGMQATTSNSQQQQKCLSLKYFHFHYSNKRIFKSHV